MDADQSRARHAVRRVNAYLVVGWLVVVIVHGQYVLFVCLFLDTLSRTIRRSVHSMKSTVVWSFSDCCQFEK